MCFWHPFTFLGKVVLCKHQIIRQVHVVKNFKTICIWSARVLMFLCSRGKNVTRKLFLFPSIYQHKLLPSAFICSNPGITILPRPHLGTQTCFAAYRRKISRVCFLVQSRPNTIANQQRIVIWHTRGVGMRLVLPWGRTSAPLKICPFWQNLSLSNKSFALVFAIVWQNVSRVQRGPIIRQLLLCFPELFDKF